MRYESRFHGSSDGEQRARQAGIRRAGGSGWELAWDGLKEAYTALGDDDALHPDWLRGLRLSVKIH